MRVSLRDASDSESDLGPDSESSDDDNMEDLEASESDADDDEFLEAEAPVGLSSCPSGLLCSMLFGSQQDLSNGYACQSRLRNARDIEEDRRSTAAGQISHNNMTRWPSDLLRMSQGLLSWAADQVHWQSKAILMLQHDAGSLLGISSCFSFLHACAATSPQGRLQSVHCGCMRSRHASLRLLQTPINAAALALLYPCYNSDPAAEASRIVTFDCWQDVLVAWRSSEVEASDAEDPVPGAKRRRTTPAVILGAGGHPQ